MDHHVPFFCKTKNVLLKVTSPTTISTLGYKINLIVDYVAASVVAVVVVAVVVVAVVVQGFKV